MDIIDGRNMSKSLEFLDKRWSHQKCPVLPGLDPYVRLDLGFWCLSWRGLANTRRPAKACCPAGRTLARDLGRRWHEWQSWGVHNQAGLDNLQPVDPPGPIPAFPTLPGLHCLCSSMPTTVGMPQLCLEIFEPFILWVIKMFTG